MNGVLHFLDTNAKRLDANMHRLIDEMNAKAEKDQELRERGIALMEKAEDDLDDDDWKTS
jgi:hypothetical protein